MSRAQRLADQLRALQIRQLAFEPTSRMLQIEIVALERELRALLASNPEPLPQLLAKVQLGELSADRAGGAIARDLGLASDVLQMVQQRGETGGTSAGVRLDGATVQSMTVEHAAGRDIIQIFIGRPPYGH